VKIDGTRPNNFRNLKFQTIHLIFCWSLNANSTVCKSGISAHERIFLKPELISLLCWVVSELKLLNSLIF
jgi:hypothetical protein